MLGGVAGFAMGGPLGAMVGAALGHAADAGALGGKGGAISSATPDLMAFFGSKENLFSFSVVVLSAKLAKVDGPIKREEIAAFRNLFHVPEEALGEVGRLFDQARESAEGWEPFAEKLGEAFADNKAMLEDVLVPVYFHHRYQVEAATKLIGGMHYNYALKGDGQSATAPLSKDIQSKAMASILKCLDPAFLSIPESIAALIPPRPAGYEFTRELFKKKTGLSFDQLAPAEAAADLPLSFLFNPERINRLVQHELLGQYGLGDMTNALIDASFKAARKAGIEKAIQFQTEQLVLTYLLAASIDEQLSFPARARVGMVLTELKSWLAASVKSSNDPLYKAHLGLAIDRFKSPEKAKPTIHAVAPPGAPIGCEEEQF